jgi:hypothetical protein
MRKQRDDIQRKVPILEELLHLTRCEQYTGPTTYEEQDAGTLHFPREIADTAHRMVGVQLNVLNGYALFCCSLMDKDQKIF